MRYPAELTAERHEAILDAAARMVRERGFEVRVADVMREAGLTHGGFYAHFDSKDALLAAACARALAEMSGHVERAAQSPNPLAAFRAGYLSTEHRDAPGQGCAIAALGPEIARAPEEVRDAVASDLDCVIDRMAEAFTGRADAAGRAKALREFSMLIGAVVLGRVASPSTSEVVLAAALVAPGAAP